MKNFRKLVAGVVVLTTLTGMSGCGSKKDKTAYTDDGRMIITIANSVAINDNTPVEQYLEKKYNVEIKTYGFGANYYDKLATMIASKDIPDVMFIVDPKKEKIAVAEAHALGIPIVAIVDTNCDPDEVDYVISGNDDAIRAVKLIASVMANAVLEGVQGEQYNPEENSVAAEAAADEAVAEAAVEEVAVSAEASEETTVQE